MDTMFENGRCGLRRLALHLGSWADYAELDEKKELVWAYLKPDDLEAGRTDHFTLDRSFSRIQQVGRNPWRKIKHVLVKPPNYGLALADIDAISIVLSPDYCGEDAFPVFIDLVRRYELELLDCLPENLEAERLRSRGKRLKREVLDEVEMTLVGRQWPPGVLRTPREVLVDSLDYSCRTFKNRLKATRKLKMLWRLGSPKAATTKLP